MLFFLLNLLTNPTVVAIVAFIQVVIAIFFYFFPLTNKRLTCGIISSTAIVVAHSPEEGITTGIEKNLEIRYGDTPVDNVYVTLIRVKNAGYVDIDVKGETGGNPPITFNFEQRILDCGVIKEGSKTSHVDWENDGQNVSFTSLLLDKKDEFLFRVLSEEELKDFKIDPGPPLKRYRPQVRHEQPNKRWQMAVKMSAYVLPSVLLLASFLLYIYIHYSNQPDIMPFAILLSVITIIYLSVLQHDIANDLMRWITRKHV